MSLDNTNGRNRRRSSGTETVLDTVSNGSELYKNAFSRNEVRDGFVNSGVYIGCEYIGRR